MAQPIWITPAGNLGTIPEGIFYQNSMRAYDPDPAPGTELYYRVIAGTLPAGIQCSVTGLIAGVPQAVASLQGVPQPVNRNETILHCSQSVRLCIVLLAPNVVVKYSVWIHCVILQQKAYFP